MRTHVLVSGGILGLLVGSFVQPASAQPCGEAKQRGCCADERPELGPLPCEPPLAPVPCLASTVEPTRCVCPSGVGTPWECVNTQEPVSRCWLLDDKPPPGALSLSLYVVAMNHDVPNLYQFVRKVGVQDLHDRIVSDLRDPQHLVVAFSESGDIGGPGAAEFCDEGPYASAGPSFRHVGCLANMLETTYTPLGPFGPKFHVVEWERDTVYGTGPALLTGWFWKPVEVNKIMIPKQRGSPCQEGNNGCCATALGVRLRSATPADKPWEVVIYVAHTKVGTEASEASNIKIDCPAWDPAKEITPMSAVGDIEAIRGYAKEHERLGDLPPLFVGDFNWTYADEIVAAAAPSFDAVDNELKCFGAPESLDLEDAVMHVFAGRMKSDKAPDGFVSQHLRQQVHFLRAVSARYTNYTDSTMYPKPGIDLPHVAHNVVALEFEIATEQRQLPKCGCSAESGGASAAFVAGVLILVGRRRKRRAPTPLGIANRAANPRRESAGGNGVRAPQCALLRRRARDEVSPRGGRSAMRSCSCASGHGRVHCLPPNGAGLIGTDEGPGPVHRRAAAQSPSNTISQRHRRAAPAPVVARSVNGRCRRGPCGVPRSPRR